MWRSGSRPTLPMRSTPRCDEKAEPGRSPHPAEWFGVTSRLATPDLYALIPHIGSEPLREALWSGRSFRDARRGASDPPEAHFALALGAPLPMRYAISEKCVRCPLWILQVIRHFPSEAE